MSTSGSNEQSGFIHVPLEARNSELLRLIHREHVASEYLTRVNRAWQGSV